MYVYVYVCVYVCVYKMVPIGCSPVTHSSSSGAYSFQLPPCHHSLAGLPTLRAGKAIKREYHLLAGNAHATNSQCQPYPHFLLWLYVSPAADGHGRAGAHQGQHRRSVSAHEAENMILKTDTF
jgi:hypothetical protein